jgi:hypothetical protein
MKNGRSRFSVGKRILLIGCCAVVGLFWARMPELRVQAANPQTTPEGKLVYADFESIKDNRPVSNRGGFIQIVANQESPARPSVFKGLAQANPPAPELVRLRKDDPNRAMAFDYELRAPNQWAAVGVEVHGQPDRDGKPVADDVTGYKYLSLQAYATGIPALRIEFTSRGNGIELSDPYPQMTFRIKPGFNTYRIPLNALAQPSWVQSRINPKDVLKNLTSLTISAFCDQCTPLKGTVVLDNLVFEK